MTGIPRAAPTLLTPSRPCAREVDAVKDAVKVDPSLLPTLMPQSNVGLRNAFGHMGPLQGDQSPCELDTSGNNLKAVFNTFFPVPLPSPGKLSDPVPPFRQEPATELWEASALRGRRLHLCLAPDKAAQEAMSATADGAGSAWVKRWGGWHISVGQPVPAESVDGLAALVVAAGHPAEATVPWALRQQPYSLRVHKGGFGLPCFCQSFLRMVTKDEAIWMGPSKQLTASAGRLQKAGWANVVDNDFHLTLGPREEMRHVLSEMVGCLWEANWVWVVGIETRPRSGEFAFEWTTARPAMAITH